MKRLAALALLMVGCTPNSTSGNTNQSPDSSNHEGHPVIPAEAVFAGDPQAVKEYFDSRGESAVIEAIDAPEQLYLVRFSKEVPLSEVIDGLKGSLDFIEPHYVVQVDSNANWPRDPEFINLWGLANYGQSAPGGVEGTMRADMQVLPAWEFTTGSPTIVVGVIDTGVDSEHPDLRDNIWANEEERAGSVGVDDDGNGYIDDVYGWDFVSGDGLDVSLGEPGDAEPLDGNGHGTHCAGTIAAIKDNNQGIVGVAPNVRIMPLRFLDDQGSGASKDAYRAIRYATENGVHILSNSWGSSAKSQLIRLAVSKANEAGILFVAAAGNASTNTDRVPHYPSSYDLPNVVSVGATDNNDRVASFSNYGERSVDVFAPGVNILSTAPTQLSRNGRPYTVLSGTSMATPHVAGVAALVLSAEPQLIGKPAELKERLLRSSDRLDSLLSRAVSEGRVNALRAVTGELNDDFEKKLVEEAHRYSSPRYPSTLTDDRHVIRKEGARAIKAHIEFAQIDEPYDSLWVYDGRNRLVMKLGRGEAVDRWTPLVEGDTLVFRFVNSKVRAVTREWKRYSSPESGFASGARLCTNVRSGEWECVVDGETTEFASFNSEGYTIDRIAYLPAAD